MSDNKLDLGSDHILTFVSWKPDRNLNPQFEELPDIEKCSGYIDHPDPEGNPCCGYIKFDTPEVIKVFPQGPKWKVVSWEPLTLEPSILCHCGDHGFIRNGQWERA